MSQSADNKTRMSGSRCHADHNAALYTVNVYTCPRLRPDTLSVAACPHLSPYREVYTNNPTPCSTVSTTDSRCEFLCGNTEKDEHIKVGVQHAGLNVCSEDRECGFGYCRPLLLQRYASIRCFVAVACMLALVSGGLMGGFVNSVITTIEKRFEIGSSVSGAMVASSEVGSLVTVVFVSYLGSYRHVPQWIGVGALVIGIGSYVFALPHVIAEKYTVIGGLDTNASDENICHLSTNQRHRLLEEQMCVAEGSGNGAYVFMLVMAQLMIGSGGTPLFTLGTTYIDDHVSREKAPIYIACMYASAALGPVIGFALGALVLQYYVDTFSYDVEKLQLSSADPRWVGAWWTGFILFGSLIICIAIPFFTFPKSLHREKAKLVLEKSENMEDLLDDQRHQERQNYGRAIKDIPKSMVRLITNPVYIITSLGICCEIIIVSGFLVFVPKYLETQFGISKSIANLLTGGIAIPGAVFGILTGGCILKRFYLQAKGAVQLSLILNVLALCGFFFLFFLGCENPKMAGATLPYLDSSGREIFQANLTSACNMQCDCSNNHLEPVCGINGITYFSPCHAGCTKFYSSEALQLLNYSGCACIVGNLTQHEEVIMSPLATSGPCKSSCDTLVPFMLMLFLLTFIVAATQMPLTMVTLRTVSQEERAFALGMQFVLLRLFAYIPAPIMFGNTIDTSCLLWKKKCGNEGSCLIYDIVSFRYKYIGISVSLKVIGLVFYFMDWLFLKHYKPERSQATAKVDVVKSTSLEHPVYEPHPGRKDSTAPPAGKSSQQDTGERLAQRSTVYESAI